MESHPQRRGVSGNALFRLSHQDHAVVLELRGNLGSLRWPSPNDLHQAVVNGMDRAACSSVVVDLSAMEHGGAQMLRLVNLRRLVRANGGRFALNGVSEALEAVVRSAGPRPPPLQPIQPAAVSPAEG
ncbi:MAG: hypothetical protein HY000_26460 [Planctomycetes bacterium]|nr:hypothetical protein [Planctomycetota bacterium]